jgi:peptidoglycan LD-endopeptidase LytH
MARSVKLHFVLAAVIFSALTGAGIGYLFGLRQQNATEKTANINSNIQLPSPDFSPSPIADPVTPEPQTSIEPTPLPTPSPADSNTPNSNNTGETASTDLRKDALMIPVVGIKKNDLQDTFSASRSGGRAHDAIDIIAPRGTPVVAAADGEIARFFDSVPGGITIYQRSADKRLMYYYAHLDRRADGIQPGQFVRRGTVIGYVGDTGNSGAGNYHLHFAIWVIDDPKRDWDGTNINPYPLLKDGVESGVGK